MLMPADAVTRRRALALGAAAGLGALVRTPAQGWAAASAARSFTLDVPAAAWARGGGRATGVLRAPRRFDLLGLRARGLAAAHVEVRVRRRGGAWSPWTPLGVGAEHAPDRPRLAGASDPVWAGGADELQLRARRAPAGAQVHFVSVPARVRGAHLRASGGAHAAQAGGPPAIVARAQWGAAGVPPRAAPAYGDVQMAFVHHTVSANDYAASDSAAIVLAIAKYHRDTNGWNDIGYNLLVDQFGQVFEGRAGGVDAAVVGAQAQGWNSHSTGVATIGTFSDVAFPEAGLASLARVLAWKLGLHGVPATGTVALVSGGGSLNRYGAGATVTFQRISGHRDGCSTSCPGDQLYAQLPGLRERVAALGGQASAAAAPPKLTLAPAAGRVAYGAGATFAGGLRGGDGAGLAGVPVVVQKQGGAAWVTVGRAVTRADGGWSVTLPWRRAGAVRALATVPGRAQVRSAPVTVALATVLDVATAPRRVRAGRSAALFGHVRPGGAVRLRVERQTGSGRWVRVADVPARVRGTRWTARAALAEPGVYRLTVRAGSVVAPPRFVRAVRHAADVDRAAGGASTTAAPSVPSAPGAGGGMAAG
jgi:N-acetylmuramoyl-L-alanine amidase